MSAHALSAAERIVGKYRIIGQLGEGGQARVYLALVTGPASFNKLLVLKVLRESAIEDPLYLESFLQEARLAAQVNHPGIVQTYEVGADGGAHYIAMEYVNGQSLRAIHRRLAPDQLPLHIHLGLLEDVARALHYTHTLRSYDGKPLNLVHRDVSPQNVMVSYEGAVKLLDFGIAKVSGNDDLTRDGMIKGKIGYMAPEQLRGGAIDLRADVFALGVMIFQAVTGKSFAGERDVSELVKMQNRLTGAEPRLKDVKPDAPEALIRLCDRALALEPEDRHPSAEELADELHDYLTEISSSSYPRELGRIVSGLFVEDRRAMETLIDQQVRLALNEADRPPASGERLLEIPVVDTTSSVSASAEVLATRAAAETSSRNAALRWALGIGIGGVVIVAAALLSRSPGESRPERTDGADVPPVATAPEPPTTPEPEPPRTTEVVGTTSEATTPTGEVSRLRVRVSPASARVELDGAELTTPVDAQLPRGDRERVLLVSAPGYGPERRTITLENDVDLEIVLRPIRGRTPSHSPPSSAGRTTTGETSETRPQRPPTATTETTDEERPRVLRPRVDVEDPYQ